MVNYELLQLLESVLGASDHKKDDNYAFHCPKCSHKYKDNKKKLEVDLFTTKELKNYFHCWRCNFKGVSLHYLLKSTDCDKFFLKELEKYVKYEKSNEKKKVFNELELPREFIPLYDTDKMDFFQKKMSVRALSYLKNRNINETDIIKYNIGICADGKYINRLIFPSYNMFNELNLFTGRYCAKKVPEGIETYTKPSLDEKKVIPYENLINFDLPIVLCEGVFDAITIKVNAIPLFGKTISNKLLNMLLSDRVQDIYICLDEDARKKTFEYVEMFLKYEKKVRFVELGGKDPNKIGYDATWKAILGSKQAEFKDIVMNRMGCII